MQCFITRWNTEKRVEKRRAAQYFWRTSRCFIWWWNTGSNVWYFFSNKITFEGEIKDAKMSSFSSDIQTLIKHLISFEFSLWIINEFEKYYFEVFDNGWNTPSSVRCITVQCYVGIIRIFVPQTYIHHIVCTTQLSKEKSRYHSEKESELVSLT